MCLAVCQARLGTRVTERQRMHIHERGRVECRAGQNRHADLAVAFWVDDAGLAALEVAIVFVVRRPDVDLDCDRAPGRGWRRHGWRRWTGRRRASLRRE